MIGTTLGPYQILSKLGEGGMGEVYRARDARLRRDVALKVLPGAFAADPDRLARFEREAQAVAALSHPNILAIHDCGSHGAITYAVMELLEGQTLRNAMRAGPLPRRKAHDYARQIARALDSAHARRIVHRDLKPENVFVTTGGHVKVLDFGLASYNQVPDDGRTEARPWARRSREQCWARRGICRRNRCAALPPIIGPTSSPSAVCSTRCCRDGGRFTANHPSTRCTRR